MELHMMVLFVFCLVILFSNIIQGITGFAGTLIAMPFLLILVDLETAKQVLNALGIVGSLWIISKDHAFVRGDLLRKIIPTMGIGLAIGIICYNFFPKDVLMYLLPVFILFIGIKGLLESFMKSNKTRKKKNPIVNLLLLLGAGIVHGLFVSGGPLLVTFATKEIDNKREFRATLSVVWLVLNSLILIQSIIAKAITAQIATYMAISIIPLLFGIVIGGILLKKMSQVTFMHISYALLIFSGISLLI
ncbi:sulfite exporter TauE/SafE family protein [Enterococcus gilvus]|uniref:Probable membrane transporter protein n=1 Tax=Enterococcus gilvus ATCC BAA-350 TaxID=1158614 RepID=R2VCQ9_9ENTE|nr:sulfite exporter TauE/SafE family protein [Enterococcus gilvus]EOI55421.1 hypothetical protein UKC_02629 [Enterococcus gilvus ATCC BAA-350]EOW82036.1 hypothetical protein I592_01337 [Enterococcus gilvus ATCC BAA-350]OJG43065.1 hypothetical protein RV02_GL002985 [Enterococcus gilvus]